MLNLTSFFVPYNFFYNYLMFYGEYENEYKKNAWNNLQKWHPLTGMRQSEVLQMKPKDKFGL